MKYIFGLVVILALAGSCKKDKPSYWYTGMEIIDSNGNFVRWVGQADDDWQINKYTISSPQLHAMTIDSLSDTASWNHSSAGTVTVIPGINPVAFYPSAVYYDFTVSFGTTCYLNYLVTDQYGAVLASHGYYGLSGGYVTINVSMPSSLVQVGNVYRVYYAFSAKGNPYFAQGWGDIGVCSLDTLTQKVNNCF
jgi:hypothetical protein